jgi:hypothetical protein
VVAVDHPRHRATQQPQQRDRLLGPDQLAGDDQGEGQLAGAVDLLGREPGQGSLERRHDVQEPGLVEAGQGRVAEPDEPLGLVGEQLGGVDAHTRSSGRRCPDNARGARDVPVGPFGAGP